MRPIDLQLANRLADAFGEVLGLPADQIDPAVRAAADPRFGDYQSNAAMALAKRSKTNPRQLAERAVAAARLDDLCEPAEVAGPGFINMRLRGCFVSQAVAAMAGDERLAVDPAEPPRTVVVDFSAPNVAKPMHVGHIRSTILGDAICRLLRFAGHRVIGDNHVGDWGTQFGKLIVGYKRFLDAAALEADAIDEMERLYRKVNDLGQSDPAIEAEARSELARLQAGDPANLSIWRKFSDLSRHQFESVYRRLGVRFDQWLGESHYNPMLPAVVDALLAAGIAEHSEGAVAAFFRDDPQLAQAAPMLIRKSDGAFLYATTDLATLRHRVADWQADEIVYVTDARQQLHFRQLFRAAALWRDRADWWPATDGGKKDVALRHVWFGTIQGPDGKPFKTRSGETIRLAELLDEAEQRARAIVQQKNPDLSEADKTAIARAVGIGAIKYFDLSNNRISDYRFDWDKMLALTGNTAPYLQYAYTRIRSIFRKGELADEQLVRPGHLPALADAHELALAKHLVRYGEFVRCVLDDYRPNILCDYLYELAGRFTGFYENCPVLKAEEPLRTDRLLLCQLAARVIRHGLDLLGIEVLEQM